MKKSVEYIDYALAFIVYINFIVSVLFLPIGWALVSSFGSILLCLIYAYITPKTTNTNINNEMNLYTLYEEYREGKEPAVNCFTKALWHWDKYGGQIVYDDNHTSIRGSNRVFRDETAPMSQFIDFKGNYGIEYLIKQFAKFMTIEELEILKRYFEYENFENYSRHNNHCSDNLHMVRDE